MRHVIYHPFEGARAMGQRAVRGRTNVQKTKVEKKRKRKKKSVFFLYDNDATERKKNNNTWRCRWLPDTEHHPFVAVARRLLSQGVSQRGSLSLAQENHTILKNPYHSSRPAHEGQL